LIYTTCDINTLFAILLYKYVEEFRCVFMIWLSKQERHHIEIVLFNEILFFESFGFNYQSGYFQSVLYPNPNVKLLLSNQLIIILY